MKENLQMIEVTKDSDCTHTNSLRDIPSSVDRTALYEKFKSRIIHNSSLDRSLVSFQANKQAPFYSWFKYREGFSERLVTYLIQNLKPQPGILLDPFAGGGSSLFTASALRWQTKGIELLPVGIYAIQARLVAHKIDPDEFNTVVTELRQINFTSHYDKSYALKHIAITRGAFTLADEEQMIGYISYCHKFITNNDICTLLLYAAFCILEDISFTRKDGQYLRWDARSGRSQGKKPFNKGVILTFHTAIQKKLKQIASDLYIPMTQQELFESNIEKQFTDTKPCHMENPAPTLHEGSCLDIIPTMQASSIDLVLTSPPYVNDMITPVRMRLS